MTTLESATIGDDTVSAPVRASGKRPPWMEKPNPITQVVKFLALVICRGPGRSSRSGR